MSRSYEKPFKGLGFLPGALLLGQKTSVASAGKVWDRCRSRSHGDLGPNRPQTDSEAQPADRGPSRPQTDSEARPADRQPYESSRWTGSRSHKDSGPNRPKNRLRSPARGPASQSVERVKLLDRAQDPGDPWLEGP